MKKHPDNNAEKNIIAAVFPAESEGERAFSELKRSSEGDSYTVYAASFIRREGGRCTVLDDFDSGARTEEETLKGGLLGMLIGVLGGPVGMLLGASAGSFLGMSHKAIYEHYGASMIEQLANKMEDGTIAIFVFADEETPDELDNKFSKYAAEIIRFDAESVSEEVNEAIRMQYDLAKQAKEQLRRDKKEKARENLKENADILSANFTK